MNRTKRALWRLFVVFVLLVGLPLALLAALVELAVLVVATAADAVGEWSVYLRGHLEEVLGKAWRSFRKGGRLNGTER